MKGRIDNTLGKEETEGFNKYAREHYQWAMKEAFEIAKDVSYTHPDGRIEASAELMFARAIFEKLASPRVFLIEKWHRLTPAERIEYHTDKEKLKEEAARVSAKARAELTG